MDTNAVMGNDTNERLIKEGANWFYWIAALSLFNSLSTALGWDWSFIVGLAITQIVDVFSIILYEEIGSNLIRILGLLINVIIAGVIYMFGVMSNKRHEWAFIIGMVVYALDGLIFLIYGDFLAVGFHVFALFFIFRGYKTLNKINKINKIKNENMT